MILVPATSSLSPEHSHFSFVSMLLLGCWIFFFFSSKKSLCDCCLHTEPGIETGPWLFRFPSLSQTLRSFPKSAANSSRTGWASSEDQARLFVLKCKIYSFANWNHTMLLTFPDTSLLPGPYWHSRMWLKCPPRPRTPREAASATSSVKPSIISKLGVISPQPLHPHLTYGNDHFLCFITYYISHPYPFCQCLSRIRFFH